MKFCISNLAWNKNENLFFIKNLYKRNINYLEFLPSKLKQFHSGLSYLKIREYYNRKSINLYSMQSLLYKKKNNYLFGTKKNKKNLFNQLKKKIYLAKILGTKIMVFGSPIVKKNILKKNNSKLYSEAKSFFSSLDKILKKNKIKLCIEANPEYYGGDYFCNTMQVLKLVKDINSKNIKLNLDFGTILSNNENLNKILKMGVSQIGHVQISSPNLRNISQDLKKHCNYIKILKNHGYKGMLSVEQLSKKKNLNVLNIFDQISK